jgi:mono/diheme cytochrome c family protein
VREGGAALGRSSSMPAWRDVLTDAEIADVVEYVQLLNPRNSR